MDTDNPEEVYNLADSLMRNGNFPAAIKLLVKLSRKNPDEPLIDYNLGIVYFSAGMFRKSVYALENAIRKGAEEVDVYNQLGLAMDRTGDRQGAEAYYRLSVEKDPGFSKGWNNLGVLRFLAEDYSEAYNFFSIALDLDAENPDTWFNFRDTCLELGFNEEAEKADSKYRELRRH